MKGGSDQGFVILPTYERKDAVRGGEGRIIVVAASPREVSTEPKGLCSHSKSQVNAMFSQSRVSGPLASLLLAARFLFFRETGALPIAHCLFVIS